MLGVRFRFEDLQKLHPSIFGFPVDAPGAAKSLDEPYEKPKSGRGPSEQGRINAWLEIVRMALEDDTHGKEWANKTNLSRHVSDLLAKRRQMQKEALTFETMSARSLDGIAAAAIALINRHKSTQETSGDA